MATTCSVRAPRILSLLALGAAVVLTQACDQSKSMNPLSPLIAGPIEGVNITLPRSLEPTVGARIEDRDQPVTLLVENPSSNSPRPFKIRLQVASDTAFATILVDLPSVAPGENGRTTVRLSDKLAYGRTYYWRTRAEDGANSSEWSATSHFEIVEPIVIGVPTPQSPVGNLRVASRQPTLVAGNGTSSGPHGALRYQFVVAASQTFGTLLASGESPEDLSGTTSFAIPAALTYDTVVYWRVRITDGVNIGDWSPTVTFQTPFAPIVPPTPPPTPPGGGSGGPPSSCAVNDGPALVACIEAKYPERLVPVSSLGERQANMAFLRDRIIESGKCGGMDLGWNLKRGGPELSIDFITHRVNGKVHGIDIGFDYDNIGTTLRLQWGEGEFPFYAAYPGFSCGG